MGVRWQQTRICSSILAGSCENCVFKKMWCQRRHCTSRRSSSSVMKCSGHNCAATCERGHTYPAVLFPAGVWAHGEHVGHSYKQRHTVCHQSLQSPLTDTHCCCCCCCASLGYHLPLSGSNTFYCHVVHTSDRVFVIVSPCASHWRRAWKTEPLR